MCLTCTNYVDLNGFVKRIISKIFMCGLMTFVRKFDQQNACN